jgi:hypothetical protein
MKAIPSSLVDGWTTAIVEWLKSLDSEDNDADVEVFRAYIDALRDFLERVAIEATPREKWEHYWSSSIVLLRSTKLAQDFSIEVDDCLNRLRLSASLMYSQHLPKMTDEFWVTLLAMQDHGQLAFSSNTCSSKSKSVAWAIMEDHAALAAAQQDGECDNAFIDAGTVEISWPLRNGMQAIYAAAVEAFRRLYHLNYLLYRHEYILRAATRKRKEGRKANGDR